MTTITTTPVIDKLVDHLMATGSYSSESEVVEAALRALDEKREREATLQAVREGVTDAEAGRVCSVDEAFRRIEERNPYLKEK